MRILTVLALALTTACASAPWGVDRSNVSSNLGTPVDSALRLAVTHLENHGFQVMELGEGVVVTQPRPLPEYLRNGVQTGQGRDATHWVMRVAVERIPFSHGSRVNVAGYLLPRTATLAGGNPVSQDAIPITSISHPQAYREVEEMSARITNAARRHRAGR